MTLAQEVDEGKIWGHFSHHYTSTHTDRHVPRQLTRVGDVSGLFLLLLPILLSPTSSQEGVLLLGKLYCCNELVQDGTPPLEGSVTDPSPLSALYQFLTHRYHVEMVAPLVIHDFLSSLLLHHRTHTVSY